MIKNQIVGKVVNHRELRKYSVVDRGEDVPKKVKISGSHSGSVKHKPKHPIPETDNNSVDDYFIQITGNNCDNDTITYTEQISDSEHSDHDDDVPLHLGQDVIPTD